MSSDIGSYLGPPPTQSGADPPDLYDRWVQLGTFEPILRLHSNNEDRLPWQYPQPVQGITESFLRLREALLPYTYTLAAEANQTGLPMARPLYLDYPDQPSAYQNPTEYLYGPDMLVAPVTTPGDVASTTVWFPPGKWVDFFTGATFTGPSSATLAVPLDRMPVFVRQGGIVPEQPSNGGTGAAALAHRPRLPGIAGVLRPLRRRRERGSATPRASAPRPSSPRRRVRLPADRRPSGSRSAPLGGAIRGEPTSVATTVEMVDVTRPDQVTLRWSEPECSERRPARTGPTRPSTATLTVDIGSRPVEQSATRRGGRRHNGRSRRAGCDLVRFVVKHRTLAVSPRPTWPSCSAPIRSGTTSTGGAGPWRSSRKSATGVVERRVSLKVEGGDTVPGIVWLPEAATSPRPTVILGHGGVVHKRAPEVLGLARRLVRHRGYRPSPSTHPSTASASPTRRRPGPCAVRSRPASTRGPAPARPW